MAMYKGVHRALYKAMDRLSSSRKNRGCGQNSGCCDTNDSCCSTGSLKTDEPEL